MRSIEPTTPLEEADQGGPVAFIGRGDVMDKSPIKPPTTFVDQLNILKKRNLTVENDQFALS